MKEYFIHRLPRFLKLFTRRHKIWSGVIVLAVVFFAYWTYGKFTNTSAETRYILASVTKGTVISAVTGTGQVSVSNQVDLKPTVSGNIVYVGVTDGQAVKAGTLIAQIDTTDAEKAVRDAQVNLQSAQIALAKLQEPADALSLTQSQNAITQADQSLITAQANLSTDYDNAFNAISNTFLDLPSTVSGLHDVLYTNTASSGQWNVDYYSGIAGQYSNAGMIEANQYKDDANAKFQAAQTAFNQNFDDYKAISRASATTTIVALLNETYNTTKAVSEAIKSANNLIQLYKDTLTNQGLKPLPAADTNLTTLGNYTSQTNTELVNLLNVQNTIQSDINAVTNAQNTITENTQSLAKLQAGADPLDIQTAQLSVQQKQNALKDAQDNLANYYIRAPFDGIVAKVNVKNTDAADPSTSIVTFISNDELAQISLNEIDAAKVKVGDKATLTFDAVPNATIAGAVTGIDTIGTVSQGVVTYNVDIDFSTSNPAIKPGMSVTAAIITDVHQDVLTVPGSAVQTDSAGNSYVQILPNITAAQSGGTTGVASATPPTRKPVTVGLSNDTTTEITSGLSEGDQVVVRTTNVASGNSATQAPSLLNAVGGGARGPANRVFRIGG